MRVWQFSRGTTCRLNSALFNLAYSCHLIRNAYKVPLTPHHLIWYPYSITCQTTNSKPSRSQCIPMVSLMSSSTAQRNSMLSTTSKCPSFIQFGKRNRWLACLLIRLIGDVLNVFRTISDDQDVRAIVLSGAGRLYTAGLDLSETQLKDKSSGDIARLTYAKRHHLQVDVYIALILKDMYSCMMMKLVVPKCIYCYWRMCKACDCCGP